MIKFENTYSLLPEQFYKHVSPDHLENQKLIKINYELAKNLLDLDLSNISRSELENYFSGQNLPENTETIALAYAGHQFGQFNPQLGDGRALLLGEVLTKNGNRYDIQLKGSGRTPYSRRGDGKSPLGPVIREYIISEAMNSLGFKTTRALAAISTGEYVNRQEVEKGGILTRVASSHIRIGTFEYFAAQSDFKNLKILADYAIDRHYPEINKNQKLNNSSKSATGRKYLDFLKEVAKKQAVMIANWMSIGFIHGVMNTDNMSISGETIDFGPCAFIDHFEFNKVFSSIDKNARYSYSNQINIGKWNLARFAECLIPLIASENVLEINQENCKLANQLVEEELKICFKYYHQEWIKKMNAKLGLFSVQENDEAITDAWLTYLENENLDFTNSYRQLSHSVDDFTKNDFFTNFYLPWQSRLEKQQQTLSQSISLMNKTNPSIIPRNHQVVRAIKAAEKEDYSIFEQLNDVLNNPYQDQECFQEYQLPPNEDQKVCTTFCGT